MTRLVIWAWSACWFSCMTGSSGLAWLPRWRSMFGNVAHVLPSQNQAAKSPPWKHLGHTSSRAGPPWLPVSGTWEGPGREWSGSYRSFHQVCPGICYQNQNHPFDYQNPMGQVHCPLWVTQKDPHRSRFETSKVSWSLTSVSWWGHGKCRLACTICKPTASVKDSILPWSICLGPYPRKRSQSGKITLECWFPHITAPKTQLWYSAPTFSCLGDNLISPSMSCLVWLHEQSWSQTPLSLYKIYGSTPSGLRKRLRHFRPKKCSNISTTMTSKVGQQPWKLGTWF